MKVIVTGGAGFIGSHLVDQLLTDGEEVIAIDDLSRGDLSNLSKATQSRNFRFVRGDLNSSEFANANIRDVELVYHLAAVNGTRYFSEKPRQVIENNIRTTENVLQAIVKNGVKKIVFSSSSEVYGYPAKFPTPETAQSVFDPPEITRWSYAVSKLSDEHLCFAYNKEFGLGAICLRLFNTYGPRLIGTVYGQVVSIFIKRALAGENLEVFGSGDQTRSFCFVSDTVRGMLLSSKYDGKRAELFNIGNEDEITINNLAEKVVRAIDEPDLNVKIDHLPSVPGDSPRRCPSIQKARDKLGYSPKIRLDDGLKVTIQWFRSQSN
jgi:UDP-glucose 4-epimerase